MIWHDTTTVPSAGRCWSIAVTWSYRNRPVTQPVAEREQRGAGLVPVATALVLWRVGQRVRVDHRHLANGAGPGEGELAARRCVAEEQVRSRLAAPSAGVPDVENRRYVFRSPAQIEGPAIHDHQDDGCSGRDDRLQQFELMPR